MKETQPSLWPGTVEAPTAWLRSTLGMHPFPSRWECWLLMAGSCPFSGQLILAKRSSPTREFTHQPLWAANNRGEKDKLPIKCRKSPAVQFMLQSSRGVRLSSTPAATIYFCGSFPCPSLLSYLRAFQAYESIWKNAQHHWSLGKFKSKLQWDIISHPLEWL